MKRGCLILGLGLLSLGLPRGSATAGGSAKPALSAYLESDRFAQATWGVHLESLDTGAVLFSTNGHRLLQPASSAKVLVAAAALDLFGAEHRLVTSLEAAGKLTPSGVLEGPLLVRGTGDYSWSDRFETGREEAVLAQMTRMVRDAGIRKVRGGLVGDTRVFRGPAWGAGWAWDDLQYGYGGEVSALMIHDGRVELRLRPGDRVGSDCWVAPPASPTPFDVLNRASTASPGQPADVRIHRQPGSRELVVSGVLPLGGETWSEALAVPDPPAVFLETLRQALRSDGIEVEGETLVQDWTAPSSAAQAPFGLWEVGRLVSPPMRDMIRVMMASSHNQGAQLLLLLVGAERQRRRAAAERAEVLWTADHGREALLEFLLRAGADPREVRLDEASGLARSSRVSPASLVRVLRWMEGHREAEAFRASLPTLIVGADGETLVGRAKSGTMSDIYALAGYLERASGETLAFSVILNGFVPRKHGEGREAVLECLRLATSLGAADGVREWGAGIGAPGTSDDAARTPAGTPGVGRAEAKHETTESVVPGNRRQASRVRSVSVM